MTPTLAPHTPSSGSPLLQILKAASLQAHFQPIVSVKRKALIGVEALARATEPSTGVAVPPPQLFGWAREEGRLMALDSLCQRSALQAFAGLPSRDPELLLFINVEASLLDESPALSLLEAARRACVRPGNIVIEVNETQVHDAARLVQFVKRHREQGFLIAMDDLGSAHSSLQRWSVLRPDIIKLDRSIVDGIAGNFFAQELVRSLIALGRQTGALILAEGIETEADVSLCVSLGVDLFQGYYFGRPAGAPYTHLDDALARAQICAQQQKSFSLERMAQRRAQYIADSQAARQVAQRLLPVDPSAFADALQSLPLDRQVVSVLLLDERGIQISPAVSAPDAARDQRAALFHTPQPGADHSDRDYYYGLTPDREFYVTEPHLSIASGQLCRTLSHQFTHPNGSTYVACLDLRVA